MASTNADFSQNDPKWQSKLLGFSTWEKIGPYGCLITAAANVFQAQGTDIDPSGVNDKLKDAGLFVRDSYGQVADVAGYSALGTITNHTHFIDQQSWPATAVAPASYFDVRSSTMIEVIAMIDYHPETAGIQTHYVRIIGLDQNHTDVEIVDSWDGKRKWLSTISSKGGKSPLQIIWSAAQYKRV